VTSESVDYKRSKQTFRPVCALRFWNFEELVDLDWVGKRSVCHNHVRKELIRLHKDGKIAENLVPVKKAPGKVPDGNLTIAPAPESGREKMGAPRKDRVSLHLSDSESASGEYEGVSGVGARRDRPEQDHGDGTGLQKDLKKLRSDLIDGGGRKADKGATRDPGKPPQMPLLRVRSESPAPDEQAEKPKRKTRTALALQIGAVHANLLLTVVAKHSSALLDRRLIQKLKAEDASMIRNLPRCPVRSACAPKTKMNRTRPHAPLHQRFFGPPRPRRTSLAASGLSSSQKTILDALRSASYSVCTAR